MIISLNASMYLFSLLILIFSLLFFLTIGGVFNAYLYKQMGDDSAWDSDYSSLNPIYHIDLFVLVVFIFLGWLIGMKKPPFSYDWADGVKGICQKFIFIFGVGSFYLFWASLFLFIGALLWKGSFVILAFKTGLKANSHFILEVSNLLKIKGPSLILAVFSLVSVVINLHLAIIDLLFSFLDFVLKKYLANYIMDFKFIIGIYLFFILVFSLYGNVIMYFFWNLISLPLYLL